MASRVTTFYPDIPLKPATNYTVSATIAGEAYSWVFTTTSEPFSPGTSYYLVTYSVWIALVAAIAGSCISLLAIKRKSAHHC
jgi:hypothetical protein